MKVAACAALAFLAMAASAHAALVITVPQNLVFPIGCSDIQIPLYVSGGDIMKSAMLQMGIGAGLITGIERKVGIFSHGQNVVDDPVIYTNSDGRSAIYSDYSLAFTQDPVPGEGLLAILHIDGTGVPWGTYSIEFGGLDEERNTIICDEVGNLLPLTRMSGSFSILPEPAGLTLLALGGLSLLRRR